MGGISTTQSAWRSWGERITRLGGGLLLARWCEGLEPAERRLGRKDAPTAGAWLEYP